MDPFEILGLVVVIAAIISVTFAVSKLPSKSSRLNKDDWNEY